MKEYLCNKCGSKEVFMINRTDGKVALMCDKCNSWIKWVGKKELPLIERYINSKNIIKERNIEIKVFDHDSNKVAYKKLTEKEIDLILKNIKLIFD